MLYLKDYHFVAVQQSDWVNSSRRIVSFRHHIIAFAKKSWFSARIEPLNNINPDFR